MTRLTSGGSRGWTQRRSPPAPPRRPRPHGYGFGNGVCCTGNQAACWSHGSHRAPGRDRTAPESPASGPGHHIAGSVRGHRHLGEHPVPARIGTQTSNAGPAAPRRRGLPRHTRRTGRTGDRGSARDSAAADRRIADDHPADPSTRESAGLQDDPRARHGTPPSRAATRVSSGSTCSRVACG